MVVYVVLFCFGCGCGVGGHRYGHPVVFRVVFVWAVVRPSVTRTCWRVLAYLAEPYVRSYAPQAMDDLRHLQDHGE